MSANFANVFAKFGYAAKREILREIWVSVAKFRQNLGNIVHFGVSLECFYFQRVVLGVKMGLRKRTATTFFVTPVCSYEARTAGQVTAVT